MRNRRANEDTPARRREARAMETRQRIADAIKEAAQEDHQKRAEADLEEAERLVEEARFDREGKYDGTDTTATSVAAHSELLGAARRKLPHGIQGRPPWA